VARVKSLEIVGAPRYRLMNQMRALSSLPLRVVPA
jgi:hypothetical protein